MEGPDFEEVYGIYDEEDGVFGKGQEEEGLGDEVGEGVDEAVLEDLVVGDEGEEEGVMMVD
jgi:hypothetical protein